MTTIQQRLNIAKYIVNWEARRDSSGRLQVYNLPSGDRGGSYEVAGINNRYHPQKAAELRSLIYQGKYTEAEQEICEYIAKYTDGVSEWSVNAAVQCYLRDCCFNRGQTGAAKILQIALGVPIDGIVGPQTQQAMSRYSPQQLVKELRKAREKYERQYMDRDESSPFWAGLKNRWNKALTASETFFENTVYRESKKMFFAIDIGHNCPPTDTGAVGIENEDKLNKEVGLRLIKILEARGHKVINVTPNSATSSYSSLKQRANTANSRKAEAFVSIHFNSFHESSAKGAEVFAFRAGTQASAMAQAVLNEILKLGFANRSVKYRGFSVLRNTDMPAILVECCFVSNPEDMSRFNPDTMALAIANGLVGPEIEEPLIKGKLLIDTVTYAKPSTEQSVDIPEDQLLKILVGSYAATLIGEEENHYCVDFDDAEIDAEYGREENYIFCEHARFVANN